MRQLGKDKGFSGCDNLEKIKDFGCNNLERIKGFKEATNW
jgi:hypothetical protein